MDTKQALLKVMEDYFDSDVKRINHARWVTEYAEKLLDREGGDRPVVIGAAILHDIGIHQAEQKHGSTLGKYQEMEGPPIARDILARLGYSPEHITEICDIIAHHHSPGKITTRNFSIVYDADWLVNLRDEYDIGDKARLGHIIDRVFLTGSGKALARSIYLVEPGSLKDLVWRDMIMFR
ncbi:MAG: HD domain-containing protein [Chloroflexi bacterium]|nr:HD domain-containing protein [Chloroflexota bacterium]